MILPSNPGPIGIFDSGYGGLTILHGLRQMLPQYDYMYLGDNARAPYGSRSFEVVYKFTRQAVLKLFSMGCHLVILGCNTASAKALRSIQQRDIPELDPDRRVLGIIRPTAEVIGTLTKSRHVGILATEGTIKSESYKMEMLYKAADRVFALPPYEQVTDYLNGGPEPETPHCVVGTPGGFYAVGRMKDANGTPSVRIRSRGLTSQA